jgi:hypothetical protein
MRNKNCIPMKNKNCTPMKNKNCILIVILIEY